jgi:hypothetical protein
MDRRNQGLARWQVYTRLAPGSSSGRDMHKTIERMRRRGWIGYRGIQEGFDAEHLEPVEEKLEVVFCVAENFNKPKDGRAGILQ